MAYTAQQCQQYLEKFVRDTGNDSFFRGNTLSQIASSFLPQLQRWNGSEGRQALQQSAEGNFFRNYDFKEFAKLALYDVHVLIDDSGSMYPAGDLRERGRYVEDYLRLIFETICNFSPGGISVHFLRRRDPDNKVRSDSDITSVLNMPKQEGSTKLGTVVKEKIWSKILGSGTNLNKPCLVYIFTDGEVTGEAQNELATTIDECKRALATRGMNRKAIVYGLVLLGLDPKIVKETRAYWDKQNANGDLFHVSVAGLDYEDVDVEQSYVRSGVTLDLTRMALDYNIFGPIKGP